MERHINTREGDGGKATLQLDVAFGLLLCLCTTGGLVYDVTQHLLDLLNTKLDSHLVIVSSGKAINRTLNNKYLADVDFLDFKVVQDVCHSLQSDELSGTDVLLAL